VNERESEVALIDEDELVEALGGLRVDPDDFRAAVERRIREAEARAESPRWLREAAAFLPLELLPRSLAGSASGLTWKALPGLLVMPALTLAMLLLPFAMAFSSLTGQTDVRLGLRREAVRAW